MTAQSKTRKISNGMKTIMKIIPVALTLLPAVALAQAFRGTRQLIVAVGDLVQILTIIVAGIALLVFFFGLMKFIFKLGGDEDAVKEGKTLMIWGIVALFVMVSVWGIIGFMQRELNLPSTTTPGNLPSRSINIPPSPAPSI